MTECIKSLTEIPFREVAPRMQELLRQQRGWQTNYFGQRLTGNQYWIASTHRSTVFVANDLDFFRFYYLTNDVPDLAGLLRELRYLGVTVTAYVHRAVDPALDAAFQGAGHRPYAVFRRMSTQSLRVCKTNSRLEFATQDDIDELMQRLQIDFAPGYADHLPSRAMLSDYIRQRWVLVIRRRRAITGYLVFQINGTQVVYNYMFNDSNNPSDFLMLQENFYGLVAEQGIRSGVLWVNEANAPVIKMHKLFKWQFDGLVCKYYVHTPKT